MLQQMEAFGGSGVNYLKKQFSRQARFLSEIPYVEMATYFSVTLAGIYMPRCNLQAF